MKRILLIAAIVVLASCEATKAHDQKTNTEINTETPEDSSRLAELDRYWIELSRTVREGDFEGYKAAYHDDAVVIFAARKDKVSLPIAMALADWKQGFLDTKTGKVNSNVVFRFSQRIGNESTAHETGIFYYTSVDRAGNSIASHFTHFEMLLVKRNGTWYALMEYQKSSATQEEWEASK